MMLWLQPLAGVPNNRPASKISRLLGEKASTSGGTRGSHNPGVGSQTAQIQLAILGIGSHPLDIASGQINLQIIASFCVAHGLSLCSVLSSHMQFFACDICWETATIKRPGSSLSIDNVNTYRLYNNYNKAITFVKQKNGPSGTLFHK